MHTVEEEVKVEIDETELAELENEILNDEPEEEEHKSYSLVSTS